MLHDLGVALCLMLVLEGIIPFLQPGRWRKLVVKLAEIDDRTMRIMGLISMVTGTTLLYIIN
ncbi:MAG: DUF2065 domain-containing protein [Pseudohongiellaceae bacterium]